jgi:hypothetical protein
MGYIMSIDKINKTVEELDELVDRSRNGQVVKDLIDKINEIIDWINAQ